MLLKVEPPLFNIRMLKDITGSQDGVKIEFFKKDEEYIITESLCNSFIKMGYCELVENINPVQERKIVTPVENNKRKYTRRNRDI